MNVGLLVGARERGKRQEVCEDNAIVMALTDVRGIAVIVTVTSGKLPAGLGPQGPGPPDFSLGELSLFHLLSSVV